MHYSQCTAFLTAFKYIENGLFKPEGGGDGAEKLEPITGSDSPVGQILSSALHASEFFLILLAEVLPPFCKQVASYRFVLNLNSWK